MVLNDLLPTKANESGRLIVAGPGEGQNLEIVIASEVVPKMVIFCRGGSENGNFPSRWFPK